MLLFHYSVFGLLVDIYKKQKLKEIQEKWNFMIVSVWNVGLKSLAFKVYAIDINWTSSSFQNFYNPEENIWNKVKRSKKIGKD